MVIGTTGLSGEELAELAGVWQQSFRVSRLPICQSVSMCCSNSSGKRLPFSVAITTSRLSRPITIRKKDAPSGTALKLGELAAEGVGSKLDDVGVFERSGIIGEQETG